MAALRLFGSLPDGRPVHAIDLAQGGLFATILTHGARLAAFGRDGGPNLVVSAETADTLETTHIYHGPVIAPVLNRIGGASAVIDGTRHVFEANQDGRHTLHVGRAGSHLKIWTVIDRADARLTLAVDLPDGEGGFPGKRRIEARFGLHPPGTLRFAITATTDAPTLMAPGLHPVFDAPAGTVLQIPAETYLPVTGEFLPTGEIAPVAGSPHDFRTPRMPAGRTDNNFCFTTPGLRARLARPDGRTVEIHAETLGLQVYDGYGDAVALEPQFWPDAPNNPHFPPILLRPGAVFSQTADYVTGAH